MTFGLEAEDWAACCHRACQPFAFHAAEGDAWGSALGYRSRLDLFNLWDVLDGVRQLNPRLTTETSRFRVLACPEEHPCELLARSVFGVILPEEAGWFEEHGFSRVTTLAAGDGYPALVGHAVETRRSWSLLDVGSCRTGVQRTIFDWATPTLVVVDGQPGGLTGFWNHRPGHAAATHGYFLPVPGALVEDPETLAALGRWLAAAREGESKESRLKIVHEPGQQASAEALGDALSPALREAGNERIERIEREVVPQAFAVPHHDESVRFVQESGREIRFRSPELPLFPQPKSSRKWMVDFVEDVRTGQPPLGFVPPRSIGLTGMLHAGPWDYVSSERSVGNGPECITLRCDKADGHLRLELPTDADAFEALARDHGLEVVADEKRGIHESLITLFGGLSSAAYCLEERPLRLLEACLGPERRRERRKVEPVTRRTLYAKAKMSGKTLVEDATADSSFFERVLPPEAVEIQRRRMQRERRRSVAPAAGDTVRELLRKWLDAGVLAERFRLICKNCRHPTISSTLDLADFPRCGVCRVQLERPEDLDRVLLLNPIVQRALTQGAPAVILALRLLERLAGNDGMSRVAGLKCRAGDAPLDLDFVAHAQGILIAGECKTLRDWGGQPATAADALASARRGLDAALLLGAKLFVFACFLDGIPPEWETQLRAATPEGVGLLLLNRGDLDRGHALDERGAPIFHLHAFLPRETPTRRTTVVPLKPAGG